MHFAIAKRRMQMHNTNRDRCTTSIQGMALLMIADFRTLDRRQRGILLKKHRGFLSRVAERAGVSRGQVSRVFWGQTLTSKKGIDGVINEVLAEIRAEERE